jgi:hypothetical protein
MGNVLQILICLCCDTMCMKMEKMNLWTGDSQNNASAKQNVICKKTPNLLEHFCLARSAIM